MTNTLLRSFVFGAALLLFAPLANAATYDWNFAGTGLSASGVLTLNGNDVTAMSGNVGGQTLTFYSNPNFPGTSTLHGVPNTGGADYIYDDFFNPITNAVTVNGILISTGTGANQVFYDLSVDSGSPSSSADLFSITKDGSYVFDEGTLSAVSATPLPPSWTMLFAAFLGLSFFAYRANRKRSAAVKQ